MARRGRPAKRKTIADPVYKKEIITQLVNKVLWKGKKSVSEKIVYDSMKLLEDKTRENPIDILEKCMENVRPVLKVKSRRVGGAPYQVPIEVPGNRSNSLAVRWIIKYSRARAGKSMIEKLSAEILDAVNNRGGAVKKREDTHKMADANRAFAHYRW